MDISVILLGVVVAILLIGMVIYNRLVALRQNTRNALADIDVQLKLRLDLVPNLVETVKGYAAHESDVLGKVTEARASAMRGGSLAERTTAENALSGALMNLMAVAENYPQLRANENFMSLQTELADIENKIAAARRFYNGAVNEYNTGIEQFPAVLLAHKFGFDATTMWEVPEGEKQAVQQAPKISF